MNSERNHFISFFSLIPQLKFSLFFAVNRRMQVLFLIGMRIFGIRSFHFVHSLFILPLTVMEVQIFEHHPCRTLFGRRETTNESFPSQLCKGNVSTLQRWLPRLMLKGKKATTVVPYCCVQQQTREQELLFRISKNSTPSSNETSATTTTERLADVLTASPLPGVM
jgi:hypothetical protein